MEKPFGFLIIIFATFAQAQTIQLHREKPRPMAGSINLGTAQFNALNPSSDFKMNNGIFLSLDGEKPFSYLGLYLEAGISYLKTSGQANYYFTSTTANYSATNVDFNAEEVQGSFGIRVKFLEHLSLHPYLGCGISGGYFQVTYGNGLQTAKVLATGEDYKTYDGVLDFSTYGEVGAELELSNSYGIRVLDRYSEGNTRPLETLRKQPLRFSANAYLLSLYAKF